MSKKNMSIQRINNGYILMSYGTIIGVITAGKRCYMTDKKYSRTTTNHWILFASRFHGHKRSEDFIRKRLHKMVMSSKTGIYPPVKIANHEWTKKSWKDFQ